MININQAIKTYEVRRIAVTLVQALLGATCCPVKRRLK